MSKYLIFQPQPRPANVKTKRWSVVAKTGPLGIIGWYARWRRYCFAPVEGCIFDAECLRDITAFMERETKEQRAK